MVMGKWPNENREHKTIIKGFFAQLYADKFENLYEMDTFLGKYSLLKLALVKGEKVSTQISLEEIEKFVKQIDLQNVADDFTIVLNHYKTDYFNAV